MQGYEREVLEGLAETLKEHRPVAWVEIGMGSAEPFHTGADLLAASPWPARLAAFRMVRQGPVTRQVLKPVKDLSAPLPFADYLISPAG